MLRLRWSSRRLPRFMPKKMRNTNEKSTKSEGQISLGVALQRPAWIGNLRRDTWLLARCPMGTQHPPYLISWVAKLIERSWNIVQEIDWNWVLGVLWIAQPWRDENETKLKVCTVLTLWFVPVLLKLTFMFKFYTSVVCFNSWIAANKSW